MFLEDIKRDCVHSSEERNGYLFDEYKIGDEYVCSYKDGKLILISLLDIDNICFAGLFTEVSSGSNEHIIEDYWNNERGWYRKFSKPMASFIGKYKENYKPDFFEKPKKLLKSIHETILSFFME